MNSLFNKPIFWFIFTFIAAAAGYVGYTYFPRAFPIVHLDLTMNRSQALTNATNIAHQFNLGPQDSRESTQFATDELVKTFVELEAGGKKQFVSMMEEHLYEPYTWQVRRFKEYDPQEVTIRFTAQGKPYGFVEKISENEKRENISAHEASDTATQFAQAEPWNINFTQYALFTLFKQKRSVYDI